MIHRHLHRVDDYDVVVDVIVIVTGREYVVVVVIVAVVGLANVIVVGVVIVGWGGGVATPRS